MHRFAVYFAGMLLLWVIWAILGGEPCHESDEVTRTASKSMEAKEALYTCRRLIAFDVRVEFHGFPES